MRVLIKGAESDAILAVEEVLANLANVETHLMGELSPWDFGAMKHWFEGHLADLAGDAG